MLPAASAISVKMFDAATKGDEIKMDTPVAEGDKVYLEITVDRGKSDDATDEGEEYAVEVSTAQAAVARIVGDDEAMVTDNDEAPVDDPTVSAKTQEQVDAVADNTQSDTVSFYIWDMAVPALPIIAQLLLAAFLAIGGYRRYLRR